MQKRLLIILLFPTFTPADSSNPAVGLITKLEGIVALCSGPCNPQNRVWRNLNAQRDVALILHEGDSIQCRGGSLIIYPDLNLDGVKHDSRGTDKTDVCKSGKAMFTIPKSDYTANAKRPTLTDYENAHYVRAGRSKGTESVMYVPSDKSVITPDQLILRWRNRPPLPKLTILVTTKRNTELFHLDEVDGSTGALDSDALRKALESVRDNPELNHDLRLTIKADMRADDSIQFSLLTHAEQDSLTKSLAQVDPSSSLLRAIERASIYESARMYDKVALEYDSALKDAPESHDLLQAAFNVNTRIGNSSRAHQLLQQLEKGDEATPPK